MIPKFYKVKQHFATPSLGDLRLALVKELEKVPIKPGNRIALGVGSRGIARIQEIVTILGECIKAKGGLPFIVPAMGSHGGATDSGQREVLDGYGVTESKTGIPVISSMETVVIGKSRSGLPVCFDQMAAAADGIIPINRIKPHTDFHSSFESGLVKMLVIGFGKKANADLIHRHGVAGLKTLIPEFADTIMEKLPVIGGLAIIENACDEIARVEFVGKNDLKEREKSLLQEAASYMPSLPVNDIDLLVVREIGKNISGVGLDPNITGRMMIRGEAEPEKPCIKNIVALDLTAESHGNALGVGLADIITKRLYDKIDFPKTYMNVITSGFLQRGFIPIVLDNDREAIVTALKTIGRPVTADQVKIIIIKNTLELENIFISAGLYEEVRLNNQVEIIDGPISLSFNNMGEMNLEY